MSTIFLAFVLVFITIISMAKIEELENRIKRLEDRNEKENEK